MVLCLPASIVAKLKLGEAGTREVILADGRKQDVPYVGPVQTTFENRSSYCGAMVMGDAVWLGAIAMEDRDLVISPKLQRIEVNPESPNIPSAVVMDAVSCHEAAITGFQLLDQMETEDEARL